MLDPPVARVREAPNDPSVITMEALHKAGGVPGRKGFHYWESQQ